MFRNGSCFIIDSNVMCFLPQVHVHRKGSGNLLNVIPARILPNEYGGEAGPLLDHWGKDLSVLSVPSPQSDRVYKTELVLSYTRFISISILNLQANYHHYNRPCHNDHYQITNRLYI